MSAVEGSTTKANAHKKSTVIKVVIKRLVPIRKYDNIK